MALGRTVGELNATMSTREWADWIAFNALEPIGDYRRDAQVAAVAAAVLNASGKRRRPASIEDCMVVKPPREKKKRTAREMFTALAQGLGFVGYHGPRSTNGKG